MTTLLLTESRLAFLASEISLILEGSPDTTNFRDEARTEITNLTWDCLHDEGDIKLAVSLWKDGTLVMYEAEAYSFNVAILQRLIGFAVLHNLQWDILPLIADEEYEGDQDSILKEATKGVLH